MVTFAINMDFYVHIDNTPKSLRWWFCFSIPIFYFILLTGVKTSMHTRAHRTYTHKNITHHCVHTYMTQQNIYLGRIGRREKVLKEFEAAMVNIPNDAIFSIWLYILHLVCLLFSLFFQTVYLWWLSCVRKF